MWCDASSPVPKPVAAITSSTVTRRFSASSTSGPSNPTTSPTTSPQLGRNGQPGRSGADDQGLIDPPHLTRGE